MISRITTTIIFVAMFSSLSWMGCADVNNLGNNHDFSAEEPFNFHVDVQNQSGLRLVGISGTISITGSASATTISVTGKRRVEGAESLSDANDCLKQLQVNVQDLGSEVSVETFQPKDTQGRNYIVDYVIVLPQTFRIQVTGVTGAVSVDLINNTVLVNSVTGSVTLNRIVGNTTVSLVTGVIDGRVTVPTNGVVDFSTVTGSINLKIPTVTSAQLTASLITGSIATSNLVFQSQSSSLTSFMGKLSDGRGTITLKTVTGGINVTGL
jgi:hypothetical protein